MAGLKEIKKRLDSVKSTALLTAAMKMVSASKLRKMQTRLSFSRTYAKETSSIFTIITSKFKDSKILDLFINGREEINSALIIVVTSNKGLCGSFNQHICKFAEAKLKENFSQLLEKDAVEVLCLGNKAREYFTSRNYKLSSCAKDIDFNIDECDFTKISSLASLFISDFHNKKYDKIAVVYYLPTNALSQDIKFSSLLPLEGIENEIDLIKPDMKSINFAETVIFPQNEEETFKEILPMLISAHLNHMLISSTTAEHGARMIAMTKASDNANALTKELKLSFNKMRQANITNELLEIISGANALNQK